jgi:hypothetical protein
VLNAGGRAPREPRRVRPACWSERSGWCARCRAGVGQRLSGDGHDVCPPGNIDLKEGKNRHDLVEIWPDVPILQPTDPLARDADRLGDLLTRESILLAQSDQLGGEPAATHEWADHRTPPRNT